MEKHWVLRVAENPEHTQTCRLNVAKNVSLLCSYFSSQIWGCITIAEIRLVKNRLFGLHKNISTYIHILPSYPVPCQPNKAISYPCIKELFDSLKRGAHYWSQRVKCSTNGTVQFKVVNSCWNTNISFDFETSGGQNSNLYLNVVHFFNTRVK